jgi:glutathione S-transferase
MLNLHITNKNYSSWSLRPWVLMQALDIPFVEKLSPFSEGSHWKEFREFSPNGLVPCLVDGDITVWDSLAIVEYLAETYQQVWPRQKNSPAWARSASAEMHSGFPALREMCSMNCAIRARLNVTPDSLQKDIDRIYELWMQGLERFGGPFLAGDSFTGVDAFYAPVVFRASTYDLPLSALSSQYVETILNIPAMLDWQAAALQEPWREASHEQVVLDYAEVTEDSRV